MTTITDYAQAIAALAPDPLPDRDTLAAQELIANAGPVRIVNRTEPDHD